MNRPLTSLVLLFALGGSAAARAESVVQGDPAHGRALYRLHCSACHGASGRGDGPLARNFRPAPPAALADPAFLMQRGDADLQRAVATGTGAGMPAFGPRFAALDAWDVVAHLRAGQPGVVDFFPDAARFTAKAYRLGEANSKRLAPLLGKLTDDEATVTVVAVFGGKKPADGPAFVPQDPRLLDALKPKRKLGYVSIQAVHLPGLAVPVLVSMALDREGTLTVVRPELGGLADKERARIEKLLAGYAGQGGKSHDYSELVPARLPPRDKDAKDAPEVAKVLTRAYYRALEGALMFDQEERERHWAD